MTFRNGQAVEYEEPALPSIHGVTLRRYRGAEDLPAMVDVVNRSREADGVDFMVTEGDMSAQFSNPLDFDPGTDVLVAEAEDRMIGLARVWYKDLKDGRRAYGHSVELLEKWRGKEIREELFLHNERHIRNIAKRDGKEKTSVFELWASDTENDWRSIILSNGYEPVQHEIDLARGLDEIPDIPLPAGFEIRPVGPEHYEAIREANKDAWRHDWDFSEDDWDEEHFGAFMKTSSFQPELWQVAWKGDTLAGMVLNYIIEEENQQSGTKRGHTEYVYVRERYRGMGLARALLARSFRTLKDHGMNEAMLGTEVENPHDALRLYKGMGFRVLRHFTWYHKPLA